MANPFEMFIPFFSAFKLGTLNQYLLMVLFAIGGFFFIWIWVLKRPNPFARYPIRVMIRERRGDAQRIKLTKARRIKKKDTGEIWYELKKGGEKIPAQDFKNINLTTKGKPFIELYSAADGRYEPCTFIINPSPTSRVSINNDDINWITHRLRKNAYRFTKKGMLEKYFPIITVVLVMVGFGFMMYFVMEYGVMPLFSYGNAIADKNYESQQIFSNVTDRWIQFMNTWYKGEFPEEPIPFNTT